MAALRLSAIVLVALLSVRMASGQCTGAGSVSCPNFVCNSTVGVPGRMISTTSFTNLVGKFNNLVNTSEITTDQDCRDFCISYYPTCVYWTRLQIAGDGTCYLYKPAKCGVTNPYDPSPTCTSSPGYYYASGQICNTLPSSPPPPPPSPPPPSPPPLDTPPPPSPPPPSPPPPTSTESSLPPPTSTTPSTPPPQALEPLISAPPPPAGVVGDPHYTGADGSHFDFTGLPGKQYCMLSDAHLHINVFHGGRFDQWDDNPHKPLTWIRRVAVFWGHHVIQLAAREGAAWQYGSGYMQEIVVDGEPVVLAQPGDVAAFASNKLQVKWVAGKMQSGDDLVDLYEVSIDGIMRLLVTARPEIELLRTPDDGVVHFSLELKQLSATPNVHGVLGQTFRPDHKNRLALQQLVPSALLQLDVVPGENAEGFIDGQAEDYEASHMLATDCHVSRFARASAPDRETAEAKEMSAAAAATTTTVVSGYTAPLPRKMAFAM